MPAEPSVAGATAATGDESKRTIHAYAYEGSRPELRGLVPPTARRILDLGCASGTVGAALRAERRAEVVGIERDHAYASSARQRLTQVIEDDVETVAASPSLRERVGTFDCLIAGDILEHLRDPWTVLRRFAALLVPGGTAVVSLPNVRYWETFWMLARHGTWPLRSEGIFDRDHLRWFTVGDALELLRQAGLEPERIERTYRLRPTPSPLDRYAAILGRTPLRPFFTYQFVVLGRRG